MTVYKPAGSKYFRYDFELNGRRYAGSTKKTTKREARDVETKERERLLAIANGTMGEDITLEKALDLFISSEKRPPSTLKDMQSRKRRILGQTEGRAGLGLAEGRKAPVMLSEVSTAMVGRHVAQRFSEGMEPGTIKLELAQIKATVNHCRKLGYTVTPLIEWPTVKVRVKTRFLFPEEEKALLDALEPSKRIAALKARFKWETVPAHTAKGLQDIYDLTIFLLDTGCRHTEVTRLPWLNVDFNTRTVQVTRWKTGKESVVHLTDRLYAILKRRYEARTGVHDTYIFGGAERGKHRSYRVAGLRKLMDDLGFNTPEKVDRWGVCTVHSFRHTYAAKLANKDYPILKLRDRLSHSSVKQTERYSHLYPDAGAAEAAALLSVG